MSIRSTCALILLCVVQGCERFAFFAMLPLFVLYLHHRHGFTEPSAMLVLGVFQALSYVGGLPGGALTDRKLGLTVAIILGAALLTLGYGALALDRGPLLWPALALLIAGHGFFRPSISTLFGTLFSSNGARRERSFLWQYLAINLGGMSGPLCADWASIGQRWDRLFLLEAVAMLTGTAVLCGGARLLPSRTQPSIGHLPGSAVSLDEPRARWGAVWLLCSLAVVTWLTFQQAGSALVLFADSHTEHRFSVFGHPIALGPARFASLHGLLVLTLLPLFMAAMSQLRRCDIEPSLPIKMVWGYLVTAAAFALLAAAGLRGGATSRVNPAWLTGCYLLLSLAELLLGPLGMSLLTRLAPPNRATQAVGLWFAAAAAGNVAAGALGLLWGRWPHHRYFALLALLSISAALVLFARLPRLERLLHASGGDAKGGQS